MRCSARPGTEAVVEALPLLAHGRHHARVGREAAMTPGAHEPPRRVAILNGSPLRGSSVTCARGARGRGARRRGRSGSHPLRRARGAPVHGVRPRRHDRLLRLPRRHGSRVRSTRARARGRGRLADLLRRRERAAQARDGPLQLRHAARHAARRQRRLPPEMGAHAARCVRDRVQLRPSLRPRRAQRARVPQVGGGEVGGDDRVAAPGQREGERGGAARAAGAGAVGRKVAWRRADRS